MITKPSPHKVQIQTFVKSNKCANSTDDPPLPRLYCPSFFHLPTFNLTYSQPIL